MKNILSIAEQFEQMTKTAGSMSRKDILKELEKAKKEYGKHKERHDSSHAQAANLQRDVADAKDKMLSTRKTVLRNHDLLRNMDLAGVDEVKFHGDDVAYIKDRKPFSAKFDAEGNVSLSPYKKQTITTETVTAPDDKDEDKNESDDYDFLSSK